MIRWGGFIEQVIAAKSADPERVAHRQADARRPRQDGQEARRGGDRGRHRRHERRSRGGGPRKRRSALQSGRALGRGRRPAAGRLRRDGPARAPVRPGREAAEEARRDQRAAARWCCSKPAAKAGGARPRSRTRRRAWTIRPCAAKQPPDMLRRLYDWCIRRRRKALRHLADGRRSRFWKARSSRSRPTRC